MMRENGWICGVTGSEVVGESDGKWGVGIDE